MVTRRTFLTVSALGVSAAAAPSLVNAPAARAATQPLTASTLNLALVNNTGSDTVYAYVTGLAIDNNNALCLLESDGATVYYPSSPSATLSPLGADCAIALNASGAAARTVTIPHLAAARVWFSIGSPLTFLLNPGPALVQPSVSNPSDPNINLAWDFCELTYNDSQLYANISAVDFACLPIGLTLINASGAQQNVSGLPTGGVDQVCSGLQQQAASDGQGWDKLIVTSNGHNLRALSPYNGMVMDSSLFQGYFEPYVSQAWQHYSSTSLTVDTQNSAGNVTGTVTGNLLTFNGAGSFAAPSTSDIFSCATGPFNTAGMNQTMLAIVPRLAAAFNRTTLLIDSNQPDGENPATYYTNSPTNHYARIVHATETNGLGYAFPYDDVTPIGGANQSGAVSDSNPTLLTITVSSPH
ncbi:glycoside hydrolase family 64 protein [Streptomyces sp. RB6PN25]|uniref:Glycoside hydrolase family 64 protein n=1 Tax=Streptomyces humicola TaxID=2953240 RepID=A0ABT1Q4D6_9ACTN|nr:glycoside hydrolase family 64 protein [Streptomyces humicola]MCQ4084784.1 glycoside hydrolase family 64 protein [Streptomyces humicola]